MDREAMKSLQIVVIGGGFSDEREVSLNSAHECLEGLTQAGFNKVEFLDLADSNLAQKLKDLKPAVAFLALHGKYGEDGCIQGMLDIMQIPYTFSGALASALMSDKAISKLVYAQNNIPVPRDVLVDMARGEEEIQIRLTEIEEQLNFPVFVKPVNNGSSYGVSKVYTPSEVRAALDTASGASSRVLVEECIEGIEITVPVLGTKNPQALPIVEIVTGAEFYDQTVKYEPSELHHVIPARLDDEVYQRAQMFAVAAHKALGCSGCSRSDFIVTADGTPIILETNAIPGMTKNSLLPDAARHAGITFPQLCETFIHLALGYEG